MSAHPFDLATRGVGVTGAAGHLGREMCLELARRGAVVVAFDRDEAGLAALIEQAGAQSAPGRVVAEAGDVSSDADVERVLDRIEAEAGAVAGFVNNAAVGRLVTLMAQSRDDIEFTLSNTLTHLMTCTQAAARRMLPRGDGSIVNIASMYGLVSPQPGLYTNHPQFHNPAPYGAAKAGVIQFTRYAACHFGGQGVRVNCISPGPFPSARVQQEAGFVAELEARVPLGRIGRPDDLTGAVVFLLSRASAYVTGHNLVVDGGWTAW